MFFIPDWWNLLLECKPRRLVDVVNYFVRHLLALGETKAENQQQKHPDKIL